MHIGFHLLRGQRRRFKTKQTGNGSKTEFVQKGVPAGKELFLDLVLSLGTLYYDLGGITIEVCRKRGILRLLLLTLALRSRSRVTLFDVGPRLMNSAID
jgi:hypothetical protein